MFGGDKEMEKKFKECHQQLKLLREQLAKKEIKDTKLFLKEYNKKNPIPPNIENSRSTPFRKRKVLQGHVGKVYAIAWEQTSKYIVSASEDGNLLVWNATSGNKKLAIELSNKWVLTCSYSPNGKYIASAGLDNNCTIYNISDSIGWEVKNCYRELKGHKGYISQCKFVNSSNILSSSGDTNIFLWDIEKKNILKKFSEHSLDVTSIDSNNNNIFVSGASDCSCKLWDIRTKSSTYTFKKVQDNDINCVKFFPNGNAFVVGDDNSVKMYDIRSYRLLNEYKTDKDDTCITSFDFTNSGYYLVCGYDEEPHCIVYNVITGDPLFNLVHPVRVSAVQTSPDGQCVITGSWDKNIRIWA